MEWMHLKIICTFLLLLHPLGIFSNKEKTVRLIVPHKIKYIHHTHILLVRPKKKSAKYQDEAEEESAYRQQLYRHDTPRNKPVVHYIVPNIASAKNGGMYTEHEEHSPYLRSVESSRRRRVPSDDINDRAKSTDADQANFRPSNFIINPTSGEAHALASDYINPKEYDTSYLAYNTYTEEDNRGLSNTWTNAYTQPEQTNTYTNGWGEESFIVPEEISSAKFRDSDDHNLWDVTSFSTSERLPTPQKYRTTAYSIPHPKGKSEYRSDGYRNSGKSPKVKIQKNTYFDYDGDFY